MNTLDTITHYINGAKVDTRSGRYGDVYNPALGAPVARVALGTSEDVDAAVQAAAAAFPSWSATPPLTRARVLFRYLQLCQQQIAEQDTRTRQWRRGRPRGKGGGRRLHGLSLIHI